ncbi:hypothetical protein GOFOIKOB_1723 [Methylobacterium tardum]|nr:hypothetical protein GOFOIKOB_1723 [Methylobacterium tardum]
MSELPGHVVGHRETMRARKEARQKNAGRVWPQVEVEQRAVDERTAKLRAMRLARENGER